MKDRIVYVYRDIDNIPFYVGMGYMKRAYETRHRTYDFMLKYNEYERILNVPCYPDIVCTHLSQAEAFELEHLIISEIGIKNLTNRNEGVSGDSRELSGRVYKHGRERRKPVPRKQKAIEYEKKKALN